MTSVVLPIRGFKFRPCGAAIVQCLQVGTTLSLEPEPDNQYDANAIKILLTPGDTNESEQADLAEALPRAGSDLAEFLSTPAWHIGYIPAEKAAVVGALIEQGKIGKVSYLPDEKGYPSIQLSAA
jgi:hypothetical protein